MNVSLATVRYVKALFSVAEARSERDQLGVELRQLGELFGASPELVAALRNPQLQTEAKKKILADVGVSSGSGLLQDFLALCMERGRAEVVVEAPAQFEVLEREAQGILAVRVESVTALDDALRTSIRTRLEESTGKSIDLVEEIHPELIGGVRLFLGSRMYDGSLKRRLDEISAHLESTRIR